MEKELYPELVNGGESQFRNEEWSTYNSVYGWHVQGIWPELSEGDDINAVDRAKGSFILVTADDYA